MLKLVYGCLAFSLVACVIMFTAAAKKGNGFHGMTNVMGDAIASNGTVLDADSDGAVTQTGNGKVTGYMHNGSEVWSTKYDRFAESPSNPYGAGAIDATAWCESECPGALVEFDGKYEVFGGASDTFPPSLNALGTKPEDILAFGNRSTVFVRSVGEGSAEPRLFALAPGRKPEALGSFNPSEIQPVRPGHDAVVGSAKGQLGSLNQLVFSENGWHIAGRSLQESDLKNICVSDAETWVGSVSTRIRRFAVGDAPGPAVGPVVTGGTCTVDDHGITAVYTPKSNPESIVATRFRRDGSTVWTHDFGAQHLLSKAGSLYVVVQAADGTVTAIGTLKGHELYKAKVTGVPFVARDGSIVTANRQGEPRWLLTGGERQ